MDIPIAILVFLGVAIALFALPSASAGALGALGITNSAVSTALVLIVSAGGVGAAITTALGFVEKRRQ